MEVGEEGDLSLSSWEEVGGKVGEKCEGER